MSISFRPLPNNVGVEAFGVNAAGLTQDDKSALYQAFLHHGVVVFKHLTLTLEQHVALSHVFGDVEPHPIESLRHKEAPEILVLKSESEYVVGWHTDLMYTQKPSGGALLRPIVIPPAGGQTAWIDTANVYAALPDQTKQRIDDLQIVMSYRRFALELKQKVDAAEAKTGSSTYEDEQNSPLNTVQFPDVTQPLVYSQPIIGDSVLNVSPIFADRIIGLPKDEADALLAELQAFATQDKFVYKHDWQENDLVVWNNWRTMHRAYPHDIAYPRILHRMTIKGGRLT